MEIDILEICKSCKGKEDCLKTFDANQETPLYHCDTLLCHLEDIWHASMVELLKEEVKE